jgi:hypothetical protein
VEGFEKGFEARTRFNFGPSSGLSPLNLRWPMIRKKLRDLRGLISPIAVFVAVGLGIVLLIDLLSPTATDEERFDYGTGLFALTSFVIAWVTVHPLPFPDEINSPHQRMKFLKTILSIVLPLALAIVAAAVLNFFPI